MMGLRIVADSGCSAMGDVQPISGKDRERIFREPRLSEQVLEPVISSGAAASPQ